MCQVRYDADLARLGEQFCWNRHQKVSSECHIDACRRFNAAPAFALAGAPLSGRSGRSSREKLPQKGTRPCGLTGGGRGAQAREAGAELADKLWVVALLLTSAKGPADGHNRRWHSSPVDIISRRAASTVPRSRVIKEYDWPDGQVQWYTSCPRPSSLFV